MFVTLLRQTGDLRQTSLSEVHKDTPLALPCTDPSYRARPRVTRPTRPAHVSDSPGVLLSPVAIEASF